MSITNGASEAVEPPQRPVTNGMLETFEQVKRILFRLPFGDMLSEHSTQCHHEDVAGDDVQIPEGLLL
jgi:hypothetical protein